MANHSEIKQLLEQQQFAEAIQAILHTPAFETDFELLSSLAEAYKALGQWANAINYYRKALALKPDDKFIPNEITLLETYLKFEKLDIYASTNLNNDPWFE